MSINQQLLNQYTKKDLNMPLNQQQNFETKFKQLYPSVKQVEIGSRRMSGYTEIAIWPTLNDTTRPNKMAAPISCRLFSDNRINPNDLLEDMDHQEIINKIMSIGYDPEHKNHPYDTDPYYPVELKYELVFYNL